MMNNEYYKYLQQLQAQALQQEAAAQATPAMPGDPNFRGPMSPPIEEIEVTAQKRQPGFFPSRIGRAMARGGGFDMTDAQKRGVYTPEEKAQFRADRNQGIGKMLFSLSDAFAGRPIAENFMAREEYAKQQELRNKKLAEQQRIREAIMNDPNIPESMKELFANDTNLYGEYSLQKMQQEAELKKQEQERAKRIEAMRATNVPLDQIILTESGVPQSIIDDLIDKQNAKKERIIESLEGSQTELKASAERASKISGLQSQGFSRIEAASIIDDDLSASDITKIREQRNATSGITLSQIEDRVNTEREKGNPITRKAPADDLANLSEAHGSYLFGDAFQENILNRAARGIFGAEPADETGAAVRTKKELDERVLQITTQNYSGRPSVFLLEQIKELIPPIGTSDKDAAESYSKISTRVDGYLGDLKREIESGQYTGNQLSNMKTDYRRLYSLSQDLKTAVGGLYDSEGAVVSPMQNMSSQGTYDNYYENKSN